MLYLKQRAFFPFFLFRLQQATRKGRTLDDYLDVALHLRCRNWDITPNQVRTEIRALMSTLSEQPPARVLEIGTSLGGTLYLFSRVSAPQAVLVSIDLPVHHSPLRLFLFRSFASPSQKIYLFTGDSQARSMCDRVQARLGGNSLDFLFIDGDHSYGGVKRDFELYCPLVRKGGLVAFHDIVPGPPERTGGVSQMWAEIRDKFPSRELVADWQQGGFGIGLIQIP